MQTSPEYESLKDLRILIVDDDESNLLLFRRVLERWGYRRVTTIADPTEVPTTIARSPADLVILDLHMPKLGGLELMERLAAATGSGTRFPFLVLTADISDEAKRRALSLGARDFLTKPVDQTELLLRVRNLLQIHHLQAELERHNETLERRVLERTRDLEQARLEVLDRLALAAEFRDDATQEHAWRIGRTSVLLARELDRSDAEANLILRAAPLHDVGKIGIPDSILLKPGKLTEEEFEAMTRHTTIGAQILSASRSPLLRLAEQIALTHHERWDGRGYPAGLCGAEIPLAGRIVAVADVFDALAHERPYKPAWPVDEAVGEILAQPGRQFDPAVVDAFSRLDHSMLVTSVSQSVNGAKKRAPALHSRG